MTEPSARRYDRKVVWGWALYDFANSAYTTLIVTFIYAVFFTQRIAPDAIVGTALWANAVTATAIVVALTSPFLGALADRGGYRRRFLVASTALTIVGVSLLSLPGPGDVALALGLFVLSNVAFELSGVFYNSYLPDVAPPEKIGRVSGYGWALGYLGGLLAMAVALVGFIRPEEPWFGVPTEGFLNVRATTVLVGVWFALFSLPMFLWVKDERVRRVADGEPVLRGTARQLAGTFREVRRYRQIFRLLV
ncbi:MAG TPA: MFS transporter, partial [Candidatus Thermoplasmatota archaeon]